MADVDSVKRSVGLDPPAWRFRPTVPTSYITYNSLQFELNEEKNRANQKKHDGIDFELAARVFADPDPIIRKDRVVEGKERWHAIGAVWKTVLLVVPIYVEESSDGEEIIRIIPAR
jgi:uncharacterized DUF497 family protein